MNNEIDFISESKKPKNPVIFNSETYNDEIIGLKEYLSPESNIEKEIEHEKNIQTLKKTIAGQQVKLEKKQKQIEITKKVLAGLTAGAVFLTIGAFIAKHKKEIKDTIGDIGQEPTATTEVNGYYPGQPNPEYESERESVIANEETEIFNLGGR